MPPQYGLLRTQNEVIRHISGVFRSQTTRSTNYNTVMGIMRLMPVGIRLKMLIKNASTASLSAPDNGQSSRPLGRPRAPEQFDTTSHPPARGCPTADTFLIYFSLQPTFWAPFISALLPGPRGNWTSPCPASLAITESDTATNGRPGLLPFAQTPSFPPTSPSFHAAPNPTGTAKTASNLPWVWQSSTVTAMRSATPSIRNLGVTATDFDADPRRQ
jgi:hypothetical protein